MIRVPYRVVLASGSPRRRELLGSLVEEFEVVVPDIEEDDPGAGDPWALAERLALEKAQAVFSERTGCLVVGGDTVVALPSEDGPARAWKPGEGTHFELLAKPESPAGAEKMLRRLAGRTHMVVTGYALVWRFGTRFGSESSYVTFRDLSDKEIRAYVATGEPLDKAGSYGIQGYAKDFVSRIEGSVSNVVGLPLEALEQALTAAFSY